MYPTLTWRKPKKNTIYITFDDGPLPEVTPFVLTALEEYNAKATFFCIGDNVRKHPEVYQNILDAGHAVGNHTFNHLNGWDTNDDTYLENIDRCSEVVRSDLFRPSYGKIRKSQIAKLQAQYPSMQIIMWDVLSGDFSPGLKPEKCLRRVTGKTCPGTIIVFHDSLKAFECLEYVLPLALKFWHKKGFKMEKL
jgi:peptidoglycan/xylan/chitin deacetylase (PgdA/CDA1 family)